MHSPFLASSIPRTPTANPPAICESCSMELEKDMPSTLSASLTKDVRSYEHERQRTKKAADLVKAKGRKEARGSVKDRTTATKTATASSKLKCSCCRSEKGSRRSFERKNVKGLWDLETNGDQGEAVDVGTRLPEISPFRGSLRNSRWHGLSTEVRFADLVTPRKPRKTKAGDFEVIPNLRSVIVLDDSNGGDLEIEEPWEHVYDDDKEEEKTKGPSYAEVVSTTK